MSLELDYLEKTSNCVCKQCFYWKAKTKELEKRLGSSLSETSQLKEEIELRNEWLGKIVDITQDCFNSLKIQTAKLEIFEHTEKWIQQLSNNDLKSLAEHFKNKLDHIQSLISKKTPRKNIGKKLEYKLKHSESYINNSLKEAKELIQHKFIVLTNDKDIKPVIELNLDKELLESIRSLKELIHCSTNINLKTKQYNTDPSKKSSAAHKSDRIKKKEIFSRENINYKYKTETRSTSAGVPCRKDKNRILDAMINRAIMVAKSSESQNNCPQIENQNEKLPQTVFTEVYEMGIFSNVQTIRHLKNNSRRHSKGKGVLNLSTSRDEGKIKKSGKTDSSLNESAGEILQTWHKMMNSIGLS